MNELYSSIENLRSEYREIFKKSLAEIANRIDELRPDGLDADVTDKFPVNSDGALWQTKVLDMLENDISKEVYRKYKEILAYRSQFKCVGCATCCNLACSEFSPAELKQKAENGDNFAAQFLSVFVPYASKEDARKVYPEYIKMLEENKEDNVYFYHCPKLTEDKRCSDYENRPQICRDFPDKQWKDEIEPLALMLHSMVEIIEYYKEKIPQ